MSTNGISNIADTDMAECDGEKVVTMMDVLQEEQDFEDDANAVLGASDEKNCTYSKGYIKRQAIYACMTCCIEAKYDPAKRAGVCLACSLNCHENHELVELYTKRNFRCDCGNPKFNSHPCQFTPNKPDLNEENNYNQNFSGLYCTCQRPYPDPESTVEDDEMIQCIICEDWLHSSHLEAVVPGVDQYSEMVCKTCMEKNEFLHDYGNLAVNIESQDVDVVEMNGDSKLNNGDLTENLVNGAGDSSNDTTEKATVNMDVDEGQNENKTSKENENDENSTSAVENSKENDSHDVTTEPENPSQISDVKSESNELDSKTDITSEETPKPSENTTKEDNEGTIEGSTTVAEEKIKENTIVSEDMLEQITTVAEEKAEESTKATEENAVDQISEESETQADLMESKGILQSENTEKPEEKIDQDIAESVKPEESIDPSEIKDKNIKIPEFKDNIGLSSENTDEALKVESNDINTKPEEGTSVTKEDDVNTETTNENDKVNNKESAEIDPPEKDATNNAENGKTSNDLVTEAETIEKEEPCEVASDMNTDAPSKDKDANGIINQTEESKDNKRKLSTEDIVGDSDHLVKKPKINEESGCIRPKVVKRVHKGATFWPSNFRQKLCTCNECLSMYKDLSVLFLIDLEDTVFAYEALGKEKVDGRATQYEKGLEALSSLDRIQQINALTEYNKMKDKLLDFLKSFKDRKEVVKEEDIKAFFAGMKPKREPDGVYFCR